MRAIINDRYAVVCIWVYWLDSRVEGRIGEFAAELNGDDLFVCRVGRGRCWVCVISLDRHLHRPTHTHTQERKWRPWCTIQFNLIDKLLDDRRDHVVAH